MRFTDEELRFIYDRTSGKCHLCHSRRAYCNYGRVGARGAWEVEHSNAQANGGTHRLNNLYAACVPCNRSKGARTTRSVRAANGNSRAPLSTRARQGAKGWNALGGGALGALAGARFGPLGIVAGAAIGALLAYEEDPDRS